jgi:hypothetical protein
MNKNNQTTGKKLSRNDMKKLQGGAPPPRFCTVPADCPGVCTNDTAYGYWCFKGFCKYTPCP